MYSGKTDSIEGKTVVKQYCILEKMYPMDTELNFGQVFDCLYKLINILNLAYDPHLERIFKYVGSSIYNIEENTVNKNLRLFNHVERAGTRNACAQMAGHNIIAQSSTDNSEIASCSQQQAHLAVAHT